MILYFDEDARPDEETSALLEAAAVAALKGEGMDPEPVSLSVSFVGKEEIRELNKNYRGVDRQTDVLSFPLYEKGCIPEAEDLEEDEELAIGDVVICEEVCEAQAKEYGHSVKREFAFLVAHSMLHLSGYDHMTEEESKEMEKRQEKALNDLGITRQD